MEVLMPNRETWRRTRLLTGLLVAAGGLFLSAGEAIPAPAEAGERLDAPALVRTLALLRPDYLRYISSVRPLAPGVARRLYMALVRPGATDPAGKGSAPYAGPGARNDIVYDKASIATDHSTAWRSLLLEHEYFHARHMAGATLLPVARDGVPEVERHYNEAAAWGFNVAEARAGRYPGLRADEFREALDRLGEHYAALRALLKDADPERWSRISELLRRPESLLTPTGAPPAAGVRLSAASDRERATP
jgi:hypothetical protein